MSSDADFYVLIVGNCEEWPQDRNTRGDGALAHAFAEADRCHLVVVQDEVQCTAANCQEQLIRLCQKTTPESTFVFYYGGHGRNQDFSTHDKEGAWKHADIHAAIAKHCQSKRQLYFIDCCSSGNFGLEFVQQKQRKEHTQIVCCASTRPFHSAGSLGWNMPGALVDIIIHTQVPNDKTSWTLGDILERLSDEHAFVERNLLSVVLCNVTREDLWSLNDCWLPRSKASREHAIGPSDVPFNVQVFANDEELPYLENVECTGGTLKAGDFVYVKPHPKCLVRSSSTILMPIWYPATVMGIQRRLGDNVAESLLVQVNLEDPMQPELSISCTLVLCPDQINLSYTTAPTSKEHFLLAGSHIAAYSTFPGNQGSVLARQMLEWALGSPARPGLYLDFSIRPGMKGTGLWFEDNVRYPCQVMDWRHALRWKQVWIHKKQFPSDDDSDWCGALVVVEWPLEETWSVLPLERFTPTDESDQKVIAEKRTASRRLESCLFQDRPPPPRLAAALALLQNMRSVEKSLCCRPSALESRRVKCLWPEDSEWYHGTLLDIPPVMERLVQMIEGATAEDSLHATDLETKISKKLLRALASHVEFPLPGPYALAHFDEDDSYCAVPIIYLVPDEEQGDQVRVTSILGSYWVSIRERLRKISKLF